MRSQEAFDVLGSPKGRAEAGGGLFLEGDFSSVERMSTVQEGGLGDSSPFRSPCWPVWRTPCWDSCLCLLFFTRSWSQAGLGQLRS